MNRHIIALLSLIIALPIMAQAPSRHEVKVGDFDKLHVVDNVNVIYRCNKDSAGMAVFTATKKVADMFIFNNNGKGKLSIQTVFEATEMTTLPTLTVYSSGLTTADNSGDSTLIIKGLQPMEKFSITLGDNGKVLAHDINATTLELRLITGKGLIQISGKCDLLKAKLVGAGTIDAEQVQAQSAQCRMAGTGTMRCTVNQGELNVRGSGSGKVYYHGKPSKVVTHKLGSLKAISLDSPQQ
ncbi:MAG: DUF2807 domain-containing protein [Muribaculaceae bacterium]|nr:DUF2807 domain-containing protein [Muribaculaceae bacterium]